jgi:hypothetical protein
MMRPDCILYYQQYSHKNHWCIPVQEQAREQPAWEQALQEQQLVLVWARELPLGLQQVSHWLC